VLYDIIVGRIVFIDVNHGKMYAEESARGKKSSGEITLQISCIIQRVQGGIMSVDIVFRTIRLRWNQRTGKIKSQSSNRER